MNLQIRMRTDDIFADMAYISAWLNETPRGFAFEHDISGNHHYHLYVFGLARNPDAMRRHLGQHLPTKECYAVSKTCGKKRKRLVEPEGAYIYGTTKRLLDPIWVKGFSDDEIMKLALKAQLFYKNRDEDEVEVEEGEKPPVKKREVRVPYQQAVIATAAAEWEKYKRKCREEDTKPIPSQVIDFVCMGMREHGRGINPYMVKELGFAVLYDDLEHRERILNNLKYNFI